MIIFLGMFYVAKKLNETRIIIRNIFVAIFDQEMSSEI